MLMQALGVSNDLSALYSLALEILSCVNVKAGTLKD
ncbi:hypothetical protein BvCmsOUP062_04041 [Escherichia coli]|nr:hypothetical protein HmCmsJML142_01374 [Escherichia coli]GDQ15733.1 hypothetical protein BvCmsNSP071_04321 [Escherichia coli]GDS45765.1 hypothetical protein BvCmsOUP062_04041 [Escherichia coli]CTZ73292.1 Uncharacterised protein [Escherichia coli]